ncbi:MAG: hypothetical protein CMJ19_02280 [Phycisphaeraceae bacterium]|nr:hypothetical protein [Phycisphaeraceae bacterium]
MRITIGKKIYFTVLGLVAVFTTVCGLTILFMTNLGSHITELVDEKIPQLSNMQEASQMMLQARRSEKDFLMRLDEKYVGKVQQAATSAIEHLNLAQPKEKGTRQTELQTAALLVQTYHDNFKQVADMVIQRGLTQEQGLRGQMRKAIHKMEERIKQLDQPQLLVDMLMCRRHEKDYLLRGQDKYVDKLATQVEKCRQTARDLKLPETDIKAMDQDLDLYLKSFNELVALDHQIAETSAVFRKATHKVEQLVEKLAEASHEEVPVIRQTMLAKIKSTLQILITCIAVGITVALIASFVMTRMITRPIAPIVKRARDIAAGDLRGESLAIRSKDELGDMTIAINKMEEDLKQVLNEIQNTVGKVTEASNEMNSTADSMSENANSQANNTNSVAAAVEELSATINEVAQQCSNAANTAENAGKSAREGGEVVNQTVNAMQTIADAVNKTAADLQQLSKRSESIGQIIEVINDIADQTNLLALNAAIEAARAGDAGRGFAVVADEVRKLAERTTKATKEVADSITAIQQETGNTVTQMQEGTKVVSTGVELASNAGQSLQDILSGSQQVAQMVTAIASAAEQQSQATKQIAQNVENISHGAQQSQASSEYTAEAAGSLSQLSCNLRDLINQFKM